MHQDSRVLNFTTVWLCSSVTDPMDLSMPGFFVLHSLPELLKLMSIELVMPSNHLIFCHPLHISPSIFPSIKIFSNELALLIRWPKYWSFSFSISPFREYSGFISFRIDWFDLLVVQGTLKSSPAPQFNSINSLSLKTPLWSNSHIRIWRLGKP